MIRNIGLIFGNGGSFYPGLPFSDNFDQGVLLPRNLIMSVARPDSILGPFLEIIPQTNRSVDKKYL